MRLQNMTARPAWFLCAVLALGGCSNDKSFIDELEVPFFKAEVSMIDENHELEMPPGLNKPKNRNRFTLTDKQTLHKKTRVVRTVSAAPRLQKIGSKTWLKTSLPPSVVWSRLQSFWKRYGYQIEKLDRERGYLLTRWRQDQSPSASRPATKRSRFVQQLRSSKKGGTITSLSHAQEIEVNGAWQKQAGTGIAEIDMLKLLQDHLSMRLVTI